jgi:molybdenum cofactor cytidylyltransferase
MLKGNSGLYSRMSVGAVLLAAGSGSRMGGRPKALLELGGVPLILRQMIALSGAGVDEVAIVLGHHAELVEAAIDKFPVSLVHNPAPDEGQESSVRLGLSRLSAHLDAVIVALADMPLIDTQDVVALIGAFKKRGGAAMVVPRVTSAAGEALPGNPVIFDAALRAQWQAGEGSMTCRHWRDAHPDKVAWLETDNQHYRFDVDTPEDLARFAALTGHQLEWPAAVRAATTA